MISSTGAQYTVSGAEWCGYYSREDTLTKPVNGCKCKDAEIIPSPVLQRLSVDIRIVYER